MLHSSGGSECFTTDPLINFYCTAKEGKDVLFQNYCTIVNLITFEVTSGFKHLFKNFGSLAQNHFSTALIKFCSAFALSMQYFFNICIYKINIETCEFFILETYLLSSSNLFSFSEWHFLPKLFDRCFLPIFHAKPSQSHSVVNHKTIFTFDICS